MKRLIPLVLFLAACLSFAQETPPVHVVVVGTTDVHGWFAGHRDASPPYGGLPLLASYVDALRAANGGRVVVVDSGDVFQGTLESNYFEGKPLVDAYNAIGYSAVAIGNHEFDYGPAGREKSVPRDPGDDPLGALKERVAQAKFPFLSANITEKVTGKTPAWLKRSAIVSVGGVKLGIIGLTTPDTPVTTMPPNVAALSFNDPVKAAVDEAASLRARGADAVIVIAHMGGRCKDMSDVQDVARGHLLADEGGQVGERYILGNRNYTLDRLFADLARLSGVEAPPLRLAPGVALRNMGSNQIAHGVVRAATAEGQSKERQRSAGAEPICDCSKLLETVHRWRVWFCYSS